MEAAVYEAEAEVEATHWWFVGRRKLFAAEIGRLGIAREARILDIGTSTGTNLRMLRDLGFTDVTGLDMNPEAVRFCREKGFPAVRQGDICAMPFGDASFDLVLATDIIEHVDGDEAALREIARVVAPGGSVLITVPAFQHLWGINDEGGMHKRRYLRGPLSDLVARAGMRPRKSYYFNYLLFLPIWLARRALGVVTMKRIRSENDLNNPAINRLLSLVFALDVRSAPVLSPPFGVSILLLAEPAAGGDPP